MNQTEVLRLFLAISIPETVRMELRRFQTGLRPSLPPQTARWARPEQFHLTLKFLGNVPARDLEALSEAVRSVCTTVPPLRLCVEGTGFFPNDFSPRVFWVEVKNPDGLLMEVQRRLEAAVEKFAEKQEAKNFTAHVTLARFEKLGRREAGQFMERARTGRSFGEWTAWEVELIQSRLSPAGAIHAILAAFKTKSD